jgi:CheY-like chemotaxis protein
VEKKHKILICDDEEGIRESLSLILKDSYDLTFAANGPEAISRLKENEGIDLVLMDIKMPKQNGIEVTREIKRLRPNLKVVIVTGYESVEVAQEATNAGADAYIPKPFETKSILRKLNAMLTP